jgi:hypothetical protein
MDTKTRKVIGKRLASTVTHAHLRHYQEPKCLIYAFSINSSHMRSDPKRISSAGSLLRNCGFQKRTIYKRRSVTYLSTLCGCSHRLHQATYLHEENDYPQSGYYSTEVNILACRHGAFESSSEILRVSGGQRAGSRAMIGAVGSSRWLQSQPYPSVLFY